MFANKVTIWRKAPFIKFLSPLVAGIALQWYSNLDVRVCATMLMLSTVLSIIPFFLSHFRRFQLSALHGIAVTVLVFSLGSLLTWYNDIRHDSAWIGRHYCPGDDVVAVLQEPLIEKANSYKTLASVKEILRNERSYSVKGNVIIYFQKDSTVRQLDFGAQIVFSKQMQEIQPASNPGGFDYRRYCLFQGITHQVFLKRKDFIVLKDRQPTLLAKILFPIRRRVLFILRKYIPGQKEQGLAEALLIG